MSSQQHVHQLLEFEGREPVICEDAPYMVKFWL